MLKHHHTSKSIVPNDQIPPAAELDVLAYLWRNREASTREIREGLCGYRPMSDGSVATLLRRLEAKGLVSRRKCSVKKVFIYRPTCSARLAYQQAVRIIAERLFGGNGLEMVSTLLGAKPPTADQLDQLEEMLNELRGKGK